MSDPIMRGITAAADTTVYNTFLAPQVRIYQADVAIPVGSVVAHDTADTSVSKVVVGASTNEWAAAGVYVGVGGTGAAATVAGTTGFAAAIGDQIEVVYRGVATALTKGDVSAIAVGEALSIVGDALEDITTPDVGVHYPFIAVEAQALDTSSSVLVRIP